MLFSITVSILFRVRTNYDIANWVTNPWVRPTPDASTKIWTESKPWFVTTTKSLPDSMALEPKPKSTISVGPLFPRDPQATLGCCEARPLAFNRNSCSWRTRCWRAKTTWQRMPSRNEKGNCTGCHKLIWPRFQSLVSFGISPNWGLDSHNYELWNLTLLILRISQKWALESHLT